MKKNLKKGLSLILTVAMVFTLVTGIQAFAADKSLDVTNSYDETTVKVGEEVTQTITLGNFSTAVPIVDGIRSFKIVTTFDSTKFKATVAKAAGSTIVADPIVADYNPDPLFQTIVSGELTVSQSIAGKLVILYADAGEAGVRSPVLAGDVLTITYTALAEGTSNVTLSTDVDFIDCAFEDSTLNSEVVQRYVTPTILVPTTSITVTPAEDPGLEPIAPLVFDATGDYIYGIAQNSTVEAVTAQFANPENIVITGAVDNIVGTGCVISQLVGNDTATVVIIGDIDGNGIINIFDYSALKSVVSNVATVTGAYNLAANVDCSSDGIVNIFDYSALKSVVSNVTVTIQAPPVA